MKVVFLLLLIIKIFCDQKLKFEQITEEKQINNNSFTRDEMNNKRKLQNFEPIRIYIDKYYLSKTNKQFTDNYDLYSIALDRVKSTLEKLIEVNREESIDLSNIDLAQYNFDTNNLDPNLISNNSFKADLVIFPREVKYGDNINECNEKQGIIKNNTFNGRPTIGYIVINYNLLNNLDDNESYKIEFLSYMFLHQITHILGFSKSIMEKTNDIDSKTEIINRIDGSSSKNINKTLISGEKIKSKMKEYYNCPSQEYIELEDQLSIECGENIHWESRILFGDYMTSLINIQEQVISEFTLAFLEDTGFYKVNYYTGGLMRFGIHQNCSFFTSDCNYLRAGDRKREPTFINEFCSRKDKSTCSSSRQSRGICQNSASLYDSNEYMRDNWENYGNIYADYCPVSLNEQQAQEVASKEKLSYIGNCKLGNRTFGSKPFSFWDSTKKYNFTIFSDSYGEVFSNTSFCAFSSAIHINDTKNEKKNIYHGFIRPTCYEMFCSEQSLTILINNQYVVCPRQGGYVRISGNYTGHVLCPDYNLICSQTKRCNNLFDCVEIGSERKENLNYSYIPVNNSMQILDDINGTDNFDKSYELSENEPGENQKCPFNCSECNLYSQCFECAPGSAYVGKRQYDQNPIKCYQSKPEGSYYNTTIKGKLHYFECIDHCKKCSTSDECEVCEPDYKLENNICVERIKGCETYDISCKSIFTDNITNNGGQGYKFCEKCNNETSNYYCLGDDKSYCENISKTEIDSYYYYLDNGCVNKCDTIFPNCSSCTIDNCTKCKDTHYLNNNKKCLKKIDNCQTYNLISDIPECNKCKDNYACLESSSKCQYIENLSIYYYKSENCIVEKCSVQFEHCRNCTKNECYNCDDNYFVNDKIKCVENIEHCLEHDFEGTDKICKQCEIDYYCVENNKKVCEYIEPNKIIYYYNLTTDPYSCVRHCGIEYSNCLTCNKNKCINCKEYFEWNTDDEKCKLPPDMVFKGGCSVEFHEINTDIKDINLFEFANGYDHLPSINAIDHYVNKDYTITVFINSECTEDLLNQGYFKIDSKELQESIKTEFSLTDFRIIYSVFVTHNFKSHFRYYDEDVKFVDTSAKCDSCTNKEYTITNKYIKNIDKAFGPLVASIVESEKLNIFERDSNVYNTICQNVTFLGIDIPLKKRLSLLYPHSFSEQMACLGENCVIEEFNFDESTCTCKCKMGNKFEDILDEVLFTHYEGESIEVNDFIDSIGIIKCIGNGFISQNLKANGGFFICIIVIVGQIALYVYYLLCTNPLVNLPKSQLKGNPPKKKIILFSDWNKILSSRNIPEGEIYIQPRDDAEEQLLDEEKSYSNDDFNASNISLDTNVDGEKYKKLSEKNKLKISEKADKRILILLKNKNKKNPKTDIQESESESENLKLTDQNYLEKKSFCNIYWMVVSLKQHIINYFSFIHCCKITKSFIPLSMRIIKSLFIFILSFVFNILFLNQNYYEKKFDHFNEKYTFIHSVNLDMSVPTGERIGYAISHTFVSAMISFILLIVVNFVVGFIFFSVRNDVGNMKTYADMEHLLSKMKTKNNIFFIIIMVLMVIFLLTLTAFCGAYGGGFVDYFVGGIISLIFLELFPFLWSLIIALLIYIGIKRKNNCCSKVGQFFMF